MVNRVGIEGEMTFFGKSFVVNPLGEIVAPAEERGEQLLLAELELESIEQTGQVLPFLRDRRPEFYEVLSERAQGSPRLRQDESAPDP